MSLDPRQAARDSAERPALVFAEDGGRTIGFGELATEALGGAPQPTRRGVLPIEATGDPRSLFDLYRALADGTPVLPLDPRLPTPERAALLDAVPVPGPPAEGTVPDDARPLAFVATSGSTGGPRLVELSRAAFAAAARASAEHLGWRRDDLWALALPWSHVGGLAIVIRCLSARRPVLVTSRFEPARLARALERHRATLLSVVPVMLDRLLELPVRVFPPPSLRAVLVGGAAAPDALVARARARGVPVLRTWGMTETCGQIATEDPERPDRGMRPLAGLTVRATGGQLEVRGPTLATARHPGGPLPLSADGFFATGDLGEVRADGRVVVHGRAAGTINTGGEKVVPELIEAALRTVPGIAEAVVFGVEDPRWGQLVAAALVASDAPLPDPVLAREIAARLGPASRPRRVAWLERLPLAGPGKPDRPAAARGARDRLSVLGYRHG